MRPDAPAAESGVTLREWRLEARDQVKVFREAGFKEEEVPEGVGPVLRSCFKALFQTKT